MIWFLSWLVVVELLALAALPVAVRVFRGLPDRGFLFAKPLGILLVAYLCWILGMFGVLRFQRATIAAVLVVLAVGCWAAWGRQTLKYLASVRPVLWTSEILFLVLLGGASLVRAYNPEISGTEKPMDFALLHAIYRSDTFPPEDPWMSGNSISYYYFGYLLLAMVAKLSGVPASVGYNLGVALVFALVLAGSYSLAFNVISMLRSWWGRGRRLMAATIAPVMVGLMGNLEIGLEVLAARGFGDASFWKWAGIKGLEVAAQPDGWFPTSHWWWWRASRVIPTTKPDGINEFPYFSFLLGDLHPHYTALPWALLAIAISLSFLVSRTASSQSPTTDRWAVAVAAVSLGFLLVGNSWDFPSYTALFWLAALALSTQHSALSTVVRRLALISFCSVLLYLPFMMGFSSQTKGIGLTDERTPLASMLIIFGPYFFVLAAFLAWWGLPRSTRFHSTRVRLASRLLWGVGVALITLSWLLGAIPLLLGLLALAGAGACKLLSPGDGADAEGAGAQRFLLLLAALGLSLILVPEFVFLVDLFGTRMNTVFKFHYQAWLMLGLAASVAIVWILAEMRPLAIRSLVVVGAALLVGVGLLYPLAATPAKTRDFQSQPTLDGAAYYQKIRPDDYAAIQWLDRTVIGRPVVLEATGGAYSEYARVSTFSGLPTVLGWAGHEVQWRGRGEEPQQRAQDIDAIYKTADRTALLGLLGKYRVEYVFVGGLEIDRYGPGVTSRFDGLLQLAHRQGRVAIYRTRSVG